MKYEELEHNEWVQPKRNGYRVSCCDCGLVHEMDFRVKKGRIEYRARRNKKLTGQIRRHINMGGNEYSHFLIRQIAKKYKKTMERLS